MPSSVVVLEMTPEEQVARIRARHEGTGTNSEARERSRIGGDWAIAALLDSRRIRDFVRSELGPELEIVVLEMNFYAGVDLVGKPLLDL